jgi:transposase
MEPLLPAVKGPMGRPMHEHRPLVEGAIYRYRTGVAWRDLPGTADGRFRVKLTYST